MGAGGPNRETTTKQLTRRVHLAVVLWVGAGVSEANIVAELVPYNALVAVEVPGGRSTDVAEPGPNAQVAAVAREVHPYVIVARRIVAHRARRIPALNPQFQHSPHRTRTDQHRPSTAPVCLTRRMSRVQSCRRKLKRAREIKAKMMSKPLYLRLPIMVVTARVVGEGDAELNGDHIRFRVRRPLVLRVPDLVVCGVHVRVVMMGRVS